jgi:hypothetical protein
LIKKDNVRITVTIPQKIHNELKNDADYEDRSVSKMAAIIIKAYYRNKTKNKHKLKNEE